MSYTSISIKEAVDNINRESNGWYLPAIQRPYVWGSRYENEEYICKLFDSILKGYPIGALIVWATSEKIPYRQFIRDYHPSDIPKLVDKGLHARSDKGLVYDGQQRLQTLYSCLRYTFNDQVLAFDCLYKNDAGDLDRIGFYFAPKDSELPWHVIRMNELFVKSSNSEEKIRFKQSIQDLNPIECTKEELILLEINIDSLWAAFVTSSKYSLTCFKISSGDEFQVNQIFERLNTGGIPLSQADLLLSKIKASDPNFEENLQICSKTIYDLTGNGYKFNAYNILQLLFLLIKGTTRIDPKKVSPPEVILFHEHWKKVEKPLLSFFFDYLWGQFKVNRDSIIPRGLALMPIIVYFVEISNRKYSFKNINSTNLTKINQYFIKSQINDWNLQTYVDNFARLIKQASEKGPELFDFPLGAIENYVQERGNRFLNIKEDSFIGYTWFGLKILMPNRHFQFNPEMDGRFNPEIDHIFPVKLINRSTQYDTIVDLIWNKQPTKGEINSYKRNLHPKDFFNNNTIDSNGNQIIGSKYLSEYDFLPIDQNGSVDLSIDLWDSLEKFYAFRRNQMINFMKTKYSIEFDT